MFNKRFGILLYQVNDTAEHKIPVLHKASPRYMRFFMSTHPDIEAYRKSFPINNCDIKYYPELDFLDISDDIKKIAKKKSKSLDEITAPYHSIGYFLNDKLVRIDNVGSGIPKETYLIWDNGLIKEAHEFYLGVRWGQKISNKAQPSLCRLPNFSTLQK